MDPRLSVLEKRLSGVRRIIAFASAKGGVGKSICSTVSALLLSRDHRVGLLDLDLQGASDHLILGKNPSLPEEDGGIIPPALFPNLSFMGVSLFSGNEPVPLRGQDTTNAIVELLSVTIWKKLDFLVIDMPPGIGEEVLDLIRFIERLEYIVINTPSPLSESVVDRLIKILKLSDARILGIMENMAGMDGSERNGSKMLAERNGIDFIGKVHFIPGLDGMVGNVDTLLESAFANELKIITERIKAADL